MKRTLLLGLLLTTGFLSNFIRAESIFDRRDRRAAYLFVDNRGRQIGDVLTVTLFETTDIDQKENRALDKKSKAGGIFSFASSWIDGAANQAASASFEADAGSNRSFDGEANFSSQREMTDRMTVTIVDVLPNGYCVIEGFRRRVISGEDRLLRVTGTVRPADVSVTNVVESRFISNLQMAYEGKGVDSKFVNQGWFSRAMNKLWPF
jgi:flagellar L-ring protein precursor FlgH